MLLSGSTDYFSTNTISLTECVISCQYHSYRRCTTIASCVTAHCNLFLNNLPLVLHPARHPNRYIGNELFVASNSLLPSPLKASARNPPKWLNAFNMSVHSTTSSRYLDKSIRTNWSRNFKSATKTTTPTRNMIKISKTCIIPLPSLKPKHALTFSDSKRNTAN